MWFLSSQQAKGLLTKRAPLPADAGIRKDLATSVEVAGQRAVRFVISNGSVDRDGDTVNAAGWDLTAYRRNPVVLWGHDSDLLPIGRCTSIEVRGGALRATAEFVPADMPVIGGMADAVLRMLQTGFLSATSVGFRPLEFELAERRDALGVPGLDFKRQELMEFSVVSIPANPDALIEPQQQEQRAAAGAYTREAFRSALEPAKMGTVARIEEGARLAARLARIMQDRSPDAAGERRRIEARLILLAAE